MMGSALYIIGVNEGDNHTNIKCETVNRMQPNLRKVSRQAVLSVISKY